MAMNEFHARLPEDHLHDMNTGVDDVDDVLNDSEFEETDQEEEYLPKNLVNPTDNWDEEQRANMDFGVVDEHMDSDMDNSDVLYSGSSENEDGPLLKRSIRHGPPEFNPDVDMRNPVFRVGMEFPTAITLKKAIAEYKIITHRRVKLVKNDLSRVRAKCVEGCPWVLHASIIDDNGTFKIKTYNDNHDCHLDYSHKSVSSKWLGRKYVNHFRANNDGNWSFEGFKHQVSVDWKVDITKIQFYRARGYAQNMIAGSVKKQYNMLRDYCEEIISTNPGSTVKLQCDSSIPGCTKFVRIYICLDACKRGFLSGCRPLVGLDGCFIKGPHSGQLLAAISVDSNNSIFPIAYAVVESECFSSWLWFLELLAEDLQIQHGHHITWISDRQKGLIDAVKNVFGESAPHRFCVRHLHNNFKTMHKGLLLKQTLWKAARASTVPEFEQAMNELKGYSVEAWQWVNKLEPMQWSRAYFNTNSSCDMLVNNLCESFNAAILNARDKSIIVLLETIRTYLMRRLETKKSEALNWRHHVGPRIFKILETNKSEATTCRPDYGGNLTFQVRTLEFKQYVVDLRAKTCACRRWNLSGIPCAHAISAINSRGLDIYDYVHHSLTKNTYLKIYSYLIRPINGPDLWRKTDLPSIEPPTVKKQRGRPKKKRRKEPGESRPDESGTSKLPKTNIPKKCRACGLEGHNKTTCSAPRSSPPLMPAQIRKQKIPIRRPQQDST